MPILGLTDNVVPSFKEVGRLRLGIPKAEAARSGPKEIAFFRADFRPGEEEAAKLFEEAYGKTPTRIHVRFPFDEISRVWDANYEVYNKTGMMGKADGERWWYLRDQRGKLIVSNGNPVEITPDCKTDANGVIYKPFDKTVPVYSYTSSQGKDVAVYAKPTGRLKLVIPELKRAVYVMLITRSFYNCAHLSAQLAAISELARNGGTRLPYIPIVLERRLETISVGYNGSKSMQDHYLVNLEIDPRFMVAHFALLDDTIGRQVPLPMPVLPAIPSTAESFNEDELDDPARPEDQYEEYDEPPTEISEEQKEKLMEARAMTTRRGKRFGDLTDKELESLMAVYIEDEKREQLTQEGIERLAAMRLVWDFMGVEA